MMMEAVRTSETSVDNHFTRQYRLQYRKLRVVAFMERHSTRLGKMF
jgi:hypothetical protein